jgi:hypothetical protein
MEDLSTSYSMPLCPTSQEGGGLVSHNQPALAMTAPGSVPVTPLPVPALGPVLPQPQIPAVQMPVSDGPGKPHPAPANDGAGRWASPRLAASLWKGTS